MKNYAEFLIIGGDSRFSYIEALLRQTGRSVLRIFPGEYTADDIANADVVILPMPATRDSINVSTPLCDETLRFSDLARLIKKGALVCGGIMPSHWKSLLSESGRSVFDYYESEELKLKNAAATAEGVVQLLISSLPETVSGSRFIITGYGRCAEAAAKALKALGAKITIAARSEKQRAQARFDSLEAIELSELPELAGQCSAVINTVPSRIIDGGVISRMRQGAIIIEIASAPFGTDFDSAALAGVTVIKAGSLPARTAPLTAGRIILDAIYAHMGGDENGA